MHALRERPRGYAPEVIRPEEGHGFYTSRVLPKERQLVGHGKFRKEEKCHVRIVSVVIDRPTEPSVSPETEQKFIRLRDRWLAERGPTSSTTKLVLHPAYQGIIGMGPAVVPLLLRELEQRVDQWFWALHAITQEDPSNPESCGNGEAMAAAWLTWGKEQGYEW